MSDDYIKRKDALDRIITYGKAHKYDDNPCIVFACENLERQMNAIPAADVVERTRWIPVTERMPAMYHPVLTFDGEFHAIEMRVPYILDDDGNQIKSDWWVEADNDINAEYYRGLRDGAATHWMPLPEPPKEGE